MGDFSFTQCAAVLFDDAPALDEVGRALEGWPASPQEAADGDDGWMACGPGFLVKRRGGGEVVVDVLDRPWPDDPRAAAEVPALAEAWRGGAFGVVTAPGALARAAMQCWAWADGAAVAKRHRAFVRLRPVLELPEEGPRELPEGYDAEDDLSAITELAGPLLCLPGATGLFFPGGEALRSREQVEAVLQRKTGVGPSPVDLWVNLRAMGLGQDGGARWVLADTVGMRQLRLPDQEAIFAEGQEEPDAVAAMLRNACLHLVGGKGIAEGSTSDDARGRRWKASHAAGLLSPERPVVRWLPEESAKPSETFLTHGKKR